MGRGMTRLRINAGRKAGIGPGDVVGAILGASVPTWWARRTPVLRPEIDALDRTSLLASAGFSARRNTSVSGGAPCHAVP